MSEFRKSLEHAINCNSMENGSDTPDFILAEYLAGCLTSFDQAMAAREKWYGRPIGTIATPPGIAEEDQPRHNPDAVYIDGA